MPIKVTFAPGESLEKSYFVATEGEDRRVARATLVLPESLHKAAATGELKLDPEALCKEFEKSCTDLKMFEQVIVNAGAKKLSVTAAKEDSEPLAATEDVPSQKAEAKPTIAAEEGLTPETKGRGGDKKVSKFYARLPGANDSEPEQAVDVKSAIAEANARIQALSEELEKKDKEVSALKGEKETMKKDKSTEEVMKLVQDKVDPKALEKIKGLISKISGDEAALGAVEEILRNLKPAGGKPPVSKPEGGDKEPGDDKKPGGMPPWMTPKASEEIRAEANIGSVSESTDVLGDSISRIASGWSAFDVSRKEQTRR